MAYNDDAVDHLLTWCDEHGGELRGCHPRDVVEAIMDAAAYRRPAPILSAQVDEARATYVLRPVNAPA